MTARAGASTRAAAPSARREGDYHRVKVTGLNSAVWPDPPGYHERKEQELRREGAPKGRPHLNRKTEGGTGNSK